MHIRPAIAADISAIMSLVNHSAAAHWSREQYEQIFVEHAPRRIALVIEEGQLQQGFLVAHELAGEWEIENIAVSPAARRRGLGTRLIGEFFDTVRSLGASPYFWRCVSQTGGSLFL